MVEVGRQIGVSSLHVNFLPEAQWRRLGEMGLLQRTGQQFHWENRGYETFDAFLESLNSSTRKAIHKERREVAEAGVTFRALGVGEVETGPWGAVWQIGKA